LLTASCVFYMAFIPVYILILVITIIIDYLAGIYIEKTTGAKRKTFLVISIVSTCAVLCVFKYLNFFNNNFAMIARFFDLNYPVSTLKIILPIGLSFHTFQSLSYVIEVYRGNQKVEKHFGIYALYVMFYPQLAAGPIERPQNLLHQFREMHTLDYGKAVTGLRLMLWGMFKKVVVADRMAVLANKVYEQPSAFHGSILILATVCFAAQIYCDFSGYSDIARGAARVMGFRLMRNFNNPYFSKSMAEFWKRWHISLSTWFRDYVYISLGGNRVARWRWEFNLFVTFLISGFWHGANWTYVMWGALNGLYLLAGTWLAGIGSWMRKACPIKVSKGFSGSMRVLFTFILASIGWMFFRARSIGDVTTCIHNTIQGLPLDWRLLQSHGLSQQFIKNYLAHVDMPLHEMAVNYIAIPFLLFAILLCVELYHEKRNLTRLLSSIPSAVRWSIYYGLVGCILFFGAFNNPVQFIYFQF